MNTKLQFNGSVNLPQAVQMVMALGPTNSLLFTGEPGIGKTAIHHVLRVQDSKAIYDHIYLDATSLDPADLVMRMPVHASKQLEMYLSSLLCMTSNKPKIIMIDEFGKGTAMLKHMLARLVLEHVIGDTALPDGSIVFGTTNNQMDGVGDSIQAHLANRLTMVRFRKPTVPAWCSYASDANIDPLIRTWLMLNPKAMDSYQDLGDDELSQNEFIFNPAKKSLNFVSPRSLTKCDAIVKSRKLLGDETTKNCLAGTAGAAFAQSFMTFQDFERDVHTPEDIIKNPKTISVPSNEGALWHMVNKAVDFIKTQDDLSAYVIYTNRFPRVEHQGIFFSMVLGSNKTKKLAEKNAEITKWAVNNYDLFM
jgi:hypothetical protein